MAFKSHSKAHKCFQLRMQSQVLIPMAILHKSKSILHTYIIYTVQWMLVEWGCVVLVSLAIMYFQTVVLFLSFKCVWYDFWIQHYFLLSFWLWKPEDVNPHTPILHPQLFKQLPNINLTRCTKFNHGSDLQIRLFHIWPAQYLLSRKSQKGWRVCVH